MLTCSTCGQSYTAGQGSCPACSTAPLEEDHVATRAIKSRPTTTPGPSSSQADLGPDTRVMLQCLPSGECLILRLDQPVLLGRTGCPDPNLYNLDSLHAHQHGVSRRHCVLQRSGMQLYVTDLGSANGTYLNDERLQAMHQYRVRDGDRLILGTLHLLVFFA